MFCRLTGSFCIHPGAEACSWTTSSSGPRKSIWRRLASEQIAWKPFTILVWWTCTVPTRRDSSLGSGKHQSPAVCCILPLLHVVFVPPAFETWGKYQEALLAFDKLHSITHVNCALDVLGCLKLGANNMVTFVEALTCFDNALFVNMVICSWGLKGLWHTTTISSKFIICQTIFTGIGIGWFQIHHHTMTSPTSSSYYLNLFESGAFMTGGPLQ